MAFIYDLTDTWNAGGTTFNAIKMNVTDSASAAASKLVTLQVGGVERFGVDKAGIGSFASVVRAAGGSTSAPAFSFTGNTNTGMWSPAADTLAFSEGGVEAMRITSAGNVGIGTATPGFRLDVVNNVVGLARFSMTNPNAGMTQTDLRIGAGSGSNDVFFGVNATGTFIDDRSSGLNIVFSRSGTERMRIDSSGNVGIGSVPAVRFQITHDQAAYSYFDYYNTTNAGGIVWRQIVRNLANTGNTSVDFAKLISSGFAINNNDTGAANFTSFGVGGAERMRIDSSGNVGIGTSSPAYRADILGVGVGNSAVQPLLQLRSASDALSNSVEMLLTPIISGQTRTAIGGVREGATANAAIYMATNNTERMRIDSSGNVGIGVTNPNARLSVSRGSAGVIANITDGVAQSLQVSSGSGYIGFLNPNFGAITFRNGSDNAEFMRIDSSGNVSIGTTAGYGGYGSGRGLTLSNQSSLIFQNASNTWNSTTAGGAVTYFSDNNMYIDAKDSGSNVIFRVNGTSERMRVTSAGEVYIAGTADQGAFNLQVNGTGVWGAGAYVNGSDRNLKQEIAPLAEALDVVNALNPVTFRYKEEYSKDQSIQPGFIAQELQEALGGEVYVDGVVQAGPEHLNVAYQSLIPVLAKAIQELTARVAQLEGN